MHADVAEKMWASRKNDQEIHLVLAINISGSVLDPWGFPDLQTNTELFVTFNANQRCNG
jgi:hypothetical protein